MTRILNLGCGNRIVPGQNVVNHDLTAHRPEINFCCDLNKTPWPWTYHSFDTIQMISVAEHLELTLIETLNECHRIIKPGGTLIIKYPLWNGPNTHKDPTHRWFWDLGVLDYVDPSTRDGQVYSYYTPLKWTIKSRGVIKNRNVKAELVPIK
jgi:SAM-dependent methyltransferase